uniref:Zmp:0000000652 n=1 Tax=Cyprinus carpio TaxID=7962 RepID=A0A8C1LHW8_CYPCA
MEGDPVTLHADANKIQKYLLIQWMFGHTRIAEVNKLAQTNSTYDGPDGRFRGRLKLDQTGSLTITNTSNTDSGLYKVTVFSSETSYMSFNVIVSETPQSSETPESPTISSFESSNQTEYVNISELHQPSSDHVHCCGCTETVIRLVVSALVSMAAVAFLAYDIRSTRNELNRMEETRHHHPTYRVNSDQHQLSRRISSRYVC